MNTSVINIDPETLGGTAVFRDTRVPMQSLFDYLESEETLNEFLENFPTVSKEQAIEVFKFSGKVCYDSKNLYENTDG